jgi:biopolymer transport protein ExbD
MKIERKQQITDEIPTSTMADIAFLLIIYFMLTATFTATRGIDFGLPKEDDVPPEIEPEDAVHIKVQPGGVLNVDGRVMQLDDILDYLKPKLERNPKKPVIIETDPQANYGYMVDVLDELRQGPEKIDMEVQNISIPTRREIEAFWY